MTDRAALVTLALAVAALLYGCAEPEPIPFAAGEFCSPGVSPVCLDGDRDLVCEDRVWVERNCAEHCAPDLAVGCGREGCLCSTVCEPGCNPRGEYVACEGAWPVVVAHCDDLCAEQPGAPEFLGCEPLGPEPACLCSLEGTACDGTQEPQCAAGAYLLTCQEGTWEEQDCAEECSEGQGSCVLGLEGPECQCAEP